MFLDPDALLAVHVFICLCINVMLDKEKREEHVHRIVHANSCLQPHIFSTLCKLRGRDAVCNINFASCKRNCDFFC
jgi:hypothetical protein